MKKSFIISSLLILALYNCKKEAKTNPTQLANTAGNNASLRSSTADNFLTFSTQNEFYARLSFLQSLPDGQVETWEIARNFLSMRSAFNSVVRGEEELSQRLDSIAQDSIPYYEGLPVRHCAAASQYAYMLVTVNEGDGSFYDANINNYNFAYLTNTYGIIKIEGKIYQFTKDAIKTIDDGNAQMIPDLLSASQSIPSKRITVVRNASGYLMGARISSTGTFVRSKIGNSGRNRTIVYQNWDQLSTSQPNTKVTSYKIRVRSLQKRLWGAWYDNKSRNLSLSGNVVGNITYGKLANGTFVTIGWSFGVGSTSSSQHTWDYFLPNINGMNQNYNALVTDGFHPQIYSSSITGLASGGASATTTYP